MKKRFQRITVYALALLLLGAMVPSFFTSAEDAAPAVRIHADSGSDRRDGRTIL